MNSQWRCRKILLLITNSYITSIIYIFCTITNFDYLVKSILLKGMTDGRKSDQFISLEKQWLRMKLWLHSLKFPTAWGLKINRTLVKQRQLVSLEAARENWRYAQEWSSIILNTAQKISETVLVEISKK